MNINDIVKRVGYGSTIYNIVAIFGDLVECRSTLRAELEDRCNITYYINIDELEVIRHIREQKQLELFDKSLIEWIEKNSEVFA